MEHRQQGGQQIGGRVLMVIAVLTMALAAVWLYKRTTPEQGADKAQPKPQVLKQVRWDNDDPNVVLGGYRVWAMGNQVLVQYQGETKRLQLPARIEKLEAKGSPQADLTAATSNVMYALVLTPQPRISYTYPGVKSNADRIIIDKRENRLFYYQKGELVKRYPVATGVNKKDTPEGIFHIAVKLRDPEGPDVQEPQLGHHWLGLAVPHASDNKHQEGDPRAPLGQKYGIHGTNEPESIGTHASAGCIRMFDRDVEYLYQQVEVGLTVEIRG